MSSLTPAVSLLMRVVPTRPPCVHFGHGGICASWRRILPVVRPRSHRLTPCSSRNCLPHIIRQTINVSSIGRRLDAKLHEQMKICVNSMLCLMARPQIHPPNVKTCLDVVNTPMCYGFPNPSMSCAGNASGSVQLGLVLRFFKDSWVCSVRSWIFWPCPHLIRQGQTRVLRFWAAPAPVSAGIARGSVGMVRSCRWEFPRILEIALPRSLWRARRTAAANIVFWQA